MSTNFIIYKFTSPSGKSYIGQTCNLRLRINKHKSSNRCVAFSDAINKYGFDNFSLEILEENLELDEANIKEEFYIKKYNTISPNGYNLQSGGKNHRCSESTKNKLSVLNFGENNPNFGKKLSDERRKKLSESKMRENNPMFGKYGILHHNYGKKHTEAAKQKMCDNHADFTGKNGPMYGKHLSDDAKEKIRKVHVKIWTIIFPNGDSKIIENLREFCRNNNLSAANMIRVAKGERKQHKGFGCGYYTVGEN